MIKQQMKVHVEVINFHNTQITHLVWLTKWLNSKRKFMLK